MWIEWERYWRRPSQANRVLSCFLLNSWTCAQLCALWEAFLLVEPPHGVRKTPRLKSCSPPALFTTQCFFLLYFFVFFCWISPVLRHAFSTGEATSVDSGQGPIMGFSEAAPLPHTSKITRALISAKNNAKKTFFLLFLLFLGNKFSTLDVSCSCPLCSMGSYFGEAWVLLSNLLSLLQMKVSGGPY